MRTLSMRRQRQQGVTLLELMMVVGIIGIIAAIAYPSYRTYVLRSNRTEARVGLEQTAGALEKCYTRYMAYNDGNCPVATSVSGGAGFNTNSGFYRISSSTLNATQFTLTATAQSTGGQSADTACATLSLDQTGTRLPATCW